MTTNTKVADLPAKWRAKAKRIRGITAGSDLAADIMEGAAEDLEAALARQEADNASSPNVIYRWRALDYSGFCYGSNPPHDLPPEACLTAFYRDPEGLRSALHEISATGNLTATDKQFSRHLQQIARDALAGAAPPPAPVGQEPVAWLHLQTGEILQKPWNPSDPHEHCNDEPVPLYAAPPAAQADDDWHLRGYAYASKQATTCAGCGEHKHTPLRIDAMGGYVCLTCIDNKLSSLLGEFGYTAAQAVDLDGLRELADAVVITNATGNERLFLGAVEKLLARVRSLIDQQAGEVDRG